MGIPRATYRIQFTAQFGFRQAHAIVSYLAALGISDVYASPIFKARKGSLHGYDVVDPNRLNPELGFQQDFEELCSEMGRYGMGWLQDIVPNHMAFDYQNAMLMDVLKNGECSPYYTFFDVDWEHPYEALRGRLLAPFLGSFFGEALEHGEMSLEYDLDEGFRIRYYESFLPLRVESYVTVLGHRLSKLRDTLEKDHPDVIKYLGILNILKNLSSLENEPERSDQIAFAKRIMRELLQTSEQISQFLVENVQDFNGRQGEPESFSLLDGLLSDQLFRLAFWKVATEEINYRRFFNVNELICLRMEDEAVFKTNHALILKLIQEKRFNGLRVDHIDGLYDPTRYLARLREAAGDVYLLVEKILDLDEDLPLFWPVQGTSGYQFLNYVNGLFCRREHGRSFSRIYGDFTGLKAKFHDVLVEKKRLILGKEMAGDVDNLALLLKRISGRNRYARDITLYGLKRALVEVMAFFPVYRSYINRENVRDIDERYIDAAVTEAMSRIPGLAKELTFIQRFLKREWDSPVSQGEQDQWMHFVMRFQQFTGPLTAKGVEDTALYVYNRLLSLNEVGGNPDRFGITTEEFHRFSRKCNRYWPQALNATATHDTKRGEDVRARLNVLSEMPRTWEQHLKLWSRLNQKKKKKVRGSTVPDKNDEYFLYQTLIGAYPVDHRELPEFAGRIKQYIIKAIREAKVHTGWLKPDADYEEGYLAFIDILLQATGEDEFMQDFIPFQRTIARYGILNSLSQVLIKLTAPGVPDFYQGSELWDLSLVDPDNRRPVDFGKRRAVLAELKQNAKNGAASLIGELLRTREDGRIKLFLIWRALHARAAWPQLFQEGAYVPLRVTGKHKDHVVAFARTVNNAWAVTVVPRFLTGLISETELPLGDPVWGDTEVLVSAAAPRQWKHIVAGETIGIEASLPVSRALKQFPVALLIGEDRT